MSTDVRELSTPHKGAGVQPPNISGHTQDQTPNTGCTHIFIH